MGYASDRDCEVFFEATPRTVILIEVRSIKHWFGGTTRQITPSDVEGNLVDTLAAVSRNPAASVSRLAFYYSADSHYEHRALKESAA
jgi:hypothetical protein